MTFQHWAGVTAYTAPCGFARCCVFVKQSLPPALCHPFRLETRSLFTLRGSSFFRSYGGILPSSLTIVLPIASVFSTRPPASVWGTGAIQTHCWAFLDSMELVTSRKPARHRVSELRPQFSSQSSYTLTRGQPSPRFTYPSVSPFSYPHPASQDRPKAAPASPKLSFARIWRYWNINQLCIDYASRPRLSSRLTLGGLAFPRNPWASGGGVSHPSLATHAYILT